MSQEVSPDLDDLVGYVLKRAAVALRSAMDGELRELGLTVPQYACLEVLSRHPGASNSELARGAFVTRQSMHLVLRGLQNRGLVSRPTEAAHGRSLPSRLTAEGEEILRSATTAVDGIEARMLEPLTSAERRTLRDHLVSCADALAPGPPAPSPSTPVG